MNKIARYSYEEAVGLSDEPSYGSRLFNTALQGAGRMFW